MLDNKAITDKKFLLALKHREISLESAKLTAKRNKNAKEIEKIDSLLIPLRDNIKSLEEESE